MSVDDAFLTEFLVQIEQIWPLLAQPLQHDGLPRPFHAQVLLRDDLLRVVATAGGTIGHYPPAVLQLLAQLDRYVSVMKAERSERELRTELAATAVDRDGAVLRAVGRLITHDLQHGSSYAVGLRDYWWRLAQHVAAIGSLDSRARELRLAGLRDALFPEQISPLNQALAEDYAGFARALRDLSDTGGMALSDFNHEVNQLTFALATAGGYLARSALQIYFDLLRLLDRVSGPSSVATLYDMYRDSHITLDDQFSRTVKRLQRLDQQHGSSHAAAARAFLWRYAEAVAVEIDPPTAALQRVLQLINDRLFGGVDAAWLRSATLRVPHHPADSPLTTLLQRYRRILELILVLRQPLQAAQPAQVHDARRAAEQTLIADLYGILQRAGRYAGGDVSPAAIEFFYFVRVHIRDDLEAQPLPELLRDVNLPGRGDVAGAYEAIRSLVLLLRADERDGTAYAAQLRELLREFTIGVVTADGTFDDNGRTALAEAANVFAEAAALSALEVQIMQTVRSHAPLIGRCVLESLALEDDASACGALILLHDFELLSRQRRVSTIQEISRSRRLLERAERATIYALGPFEHDVVHRFRQTLTQLSNGGHPLALFFLQQEDRRQGTRLTDAVAVLLQQYQAELSGNVHPLLSVAATADGSAAPLLAQVYQLLNMGDHRGALSALEAGLLVETADDARAVLLCLRAGTFRRLGLVDAAVTDLYAALQVVPADGEQARTATVALCEILLERGDHQRAAATASQLLARQPQADQLLLLRAAALLADGQPAAALADYRNVLERQPTRGDIWLLCSQAAAAAGDLRQALADVTMAIRLASPLQPAELLAARYQRGRCYLQLAETDGVSPGARSQLLQTVYQDFRALLDDPQFSAAIPDGLAAETAALAERLAAPV